MTTDTPAVATIPAAAMAPFTPAEARDIADNVRRASVADLTMWRTRAHRIITNYRGVPTTRAAADVQRANRVAATIDGELVARGRNEAGNIVRRGTVTVDIATVVRDAVDPVRTDDGGAVFGMALGELGFADVVTMRSGAMIADHPTGVRVTTRPDATDTAPDYVTVYGGRDVDGPRRGDTWSVTFTGATPVGVVVAAVAAAVRMPNA